MTYLELFSISEQFSPMMRQYLELKKNNLDSLLLFRLGDFYEAFFDDAVTISKELNLYLTARDSGVEQRAPMCGVPYHAIDNYLERLINKGYKIAVAEQTEDPALAKGLVKREVTRYMTPGTLLDIGLDEKSNNYIGCLIDSYISYILVYGDISTGELYGIFIDYDDKIILGELKSLKIKEIIYDGNNISKELINTLITQGYTLTEYNDDSKQKGYNYFLGDYKNSAIQKGLFTLLNYLKKSGIDFENYFKKIIIELQNSYLYIDNISRNNLEIFVTTGGSEKNSLLDIIDKTNTAIGARTLRTYLLRPLYDKTRINDRLDKVEYLVNQYLLRDDIQKQLKEIYDLDRIVSRIDNNSNNARDCLQLKESLKAIKKIKDILITHSIFSETISKLNTLDEIVETIEKGIVEKPPIQIKEGEIFKYGYDKKLDQIKDKISELQKELIQYEIDIKVKTGIKNIKIGYTSNFGYFIEVTKGSIDLVKEEFLLERKQTLTNSERYSTPKLKEIEKELVSLEFKQKNKEYELFEELRNKIKPLTRDIQETAVIIAELDVLVCFACSAVKNNYCRPVFHEKKALDIKNSRHAVLEQLLKDKCISNDYLLEEEERMLLLTGPNMGGKSTYMRQLAIIVILAQVGSFVPAEKAEMPLFNRIFTRIGASDDTTNGKSTFMVEMQEVATALKYSNKDSLVLFDEIGRGTATFDGLSLAEAIIEYIIYHNKAFVVFSTHYHQLTKLSLKYKEIKNITITVLFRNNNLQFLYKVIPGVTEKSYGIHVAELAGIPVDVVKSASVILDRLEESNNTKINNNDRVFINNSIAEKNETEKLISSLSLDDLSPREAWDILQQLYFKVKDK